MRALLLQAFHSVRSERLLIEQLDYNLLSRWLVGLGIDDPVWHRTVFTTDRDRLLEGEVAARFLAAVLNHARLRQLLSREHFSVDADRRVSIAEEFPPQGGRRRAADRRSQRQPELPRRAAAQRHPCLDHRWRGAATAGSVAALRRLNTTPHVAQNISGQTSRIDRRTARHPGYLAIQRARKQIEEVFAWIKTIAGQAKTSFRGTAQVGWAFTLAAAAHNLIRLPKLLAARP